MKKICLAAMIVVLGSGGALASTEFPGLYDARSTGMGGTGSAYLDSGAAMYANPALLDQIGNMVFTLDSSTVWIKKQAPMPVVRSTGMEYEPLTTPSRLNRDWQPVGMIGGAYRVNERVVVGAGAYPTSGFGSSFEEYQPYPETNPNLKLDMEVSCAIVEVAFPVSVRLSDNAAVALMWRPTYFSQTASSPITDSSGYTTNAQGASVGNADVSVSDWNLKGLQVGIFYKPLPQVRLGFSYRNKMKFKGKGNTETLNPADGYTSALSLDTVTTFNAPHWFRGGIAVSLLENKLLLAADAKYIMYKDSNKSATTTMSFPESLGGGQHVRTQELQWKDVVEVAFGAEYHMNERFAGRLGYSIHNSATPERYASLLKPSPGIMHTFHTGFGVNATPNLTIDLGISYMYLSETITSASDTNPYVGKHKNECSVIAISATYRK